MNDWIAELRDDSRAERSLRQPCRASRTRCLHAPRARDERRHHVRLDHRAPSRTPTTPTRRAQADRDGRGRLPAWWHHVLRDRDESRAGPDPERGGHGRDGTGEPCDRAGDGGRVVPSLGRHLEGRRVRAARGPPRIPGMVETSYTVFAARSTWWPTASTSRSTTVGFEYEFGACTKEVDLDW